MLKKAAEAILNIGQLLFPRESVKPERVAERSTFRREISFLQCGQRAFRKAERLPLLSPRTIHARSLFPSHKAALIPFLKGEMEGQGHLLAANYTTSPGLVFLHVH